MGAVMLMPHRRGRKTASAYPVLPCLDSSMRSLDEHRLTASPP
ncbi:unnamed protein product [Ixodes persulcatus]